MRLHYYKYSLTKGVQKIKTRTAIFIATSAIALASGFGLAASVPFMASAAPPSPNPAGNSAPKATGSVGYTAIGLQRYADFSAIQTSSTCSATHSITGSYVFTLSLDGNTYAHDVNLVNTNGTLTGTGGYPSGGPYSINETITGTATNSDFMFTSDYGNGYSYTVNGTIASDGTLTVTGWSDSNGLGATGTWVVIGNGTQTVTGCTGKGTFNYSDANGNFYTVNVQYVQVLGARTWFAGPVVSGNVGAGQWLFAEVQDVGTPGSNGDLIWGSFTTQSAAQQGVATMHDPADGSFAITSGNLVVHT